MTDIRVKTRECFRKLLEKKMDMDPDHVLEWIVDIEEGIYQASKDSKEAAGMEHDLDAELVTKVPSKIHRKASGPCIMTVKTKPFTKVYEGIRWKVYCALSTNSGADQLLDRLCEENIFPNQLGGMTHFQLNPNCYAAKREREKVLEAEKSGRIWKPGIGKHGIQIKIPYDVMEEYNETTGKYVETVVEVPDSMLTCGKCGMSKTTSYEMQTRSADEPMTIFAKCLCCENRWRF